tara:strand:- start:229 stop:975 length:747 start_codon:yes stop_codon:yes gene_type:complete
MKIISIFLILFSLGASEIVDDLFDDGNNSMLAERYEDAIQTYESILVLGYQSGELYYNLGNAYYRNDNLGQAIWAYSKAQYILPRNINIKHNLEVSMAQKIDRIDMPKPFFLLKLYREIKLKYNLQEWILFGSIILLAQAFWILSIQIGWLNSSFNQSLVSLFTFIVISIHGISVDKYLENNRTQTGIVIANNINAYSGPYFGEKTILFKINEGSNVDIVQRQNDWFEIILIDGKKGWIPNSAVRKLK